MVFFLLQVVLFAGDGTCPVVHAPDQTPLDMGWVVGLEAQVAVSVGGLPVDSDVQATILPLAEEGVQEWEHSNLLYLDSELDGGSHTVEVIQETFCCALLHNANIIKLPIPKAVLHWGGVQGKLLEELHVKVGHHRGDRWTHRCTFALFVYRRLLYG